MPEVAVCPRCDGERRVYNKRSGQSESCPTCGGEGVKWKREVSEAAEPAEDHRDLTYEP